MLRFASSKFRVLGGVGRTPGGALGGTQRAFRSGLAAQTGWFSAPAPPPPVESTALSDVPRYRSGAQGVLKQFDAFKLRSESASRSLMVTDLGVVERQYARWVKNLPRVQPFYAVKCNPDPLLLETLVLCGAGFDCATRAELDVAVPIFRQATDQPTGEPNVILANPIKSLPDLQAARNHEVALMTFDNADELHKIRAHCPDAQVVLRLLPDDSGSLMRFGSKFGADISVVPELITLCKELELDLAGVSLHIGSGCFDERKYHDAIKLCSQAFAIAEDLGLHMRLLNLGGGFPGNPVPWQSTPSAEGVTPSFEQFAKVVAESLDEFFPVQAYPADRLRIIAEPGRYFATAASTLFTLVQGKRKQPPVKAGQADEYLYYINDGVYGSFNCIMFDHAKLRPLTIGEFTEQNMQDVPCAAVFPPTLISEPEHVTARPQGMIQSAGVSSAAGRERKPRGTIFGPTCDSMDVVVKDLAIDELQVGDYLAFEHMGAYTSAAASQFNGVPLPEVKYIRSDLDDER